MSFRGLFEIHKLRESLFGNLKSGTDLSLCIKTNTVKEKNTLVNIFEYYHSSYTI